MGVTTTKEGDDQRLEIDRLSGGITPFRNRLPLDYLEFQWADYLRAHWAQTGIATKDIDTNFDSATGRGFALGGREGRGKPTWLYR